MVILPHATLQKYLKPSRARTASGSPGVPERPQERGGAEIGKWVLERKQNQEH